VPRRARRGCGKPGPADLKTLLVSIHLAILNRAKAEGNPSLDLLGRVAVLKFIRSELQGQFARILETLPHEAKALEGVRQTTMMQTQQTVSSFQVHKKIILRRAGQELFRLLREIEKETLGVPGVRCWANRPWENRASLNRCPVSFPPMPIACSSIRSFLPRMAATISLCAEHYYMFGNFDKDPDRFPSLRQFALSFLRELGYGEAIDDEHLGQALNVPENATALVGTGNGEDLTEEDRCRKDRLEFGLAYCSAKARFPTWSRLTRRFRSWPIMRPWSTRSRSRTP